MFAPSQTSVEAVTRWLITAGIANVSLSVNRQWVQFDVFAEKVEELLLAEFYEYEHVASGSKTIAVDEYHVPVGLQEHVDYITPGVRLRVDPAKLKRTIRSKMKKRAINKGSRQHHEEALHTDVESLVDISSSLGACDVDLTAACIRAQYNIPESTLAAPGNELGIFEGLDEHYSKADLDTFWATLHPYIPQGTYPEERLIDGAIGAVEEVGARYNQSVAGVEADMDLEAAWPLIWPQKTVLFQSDDEFYEVNQTSPDTIYLGYWNTFLDAIDGSYCAYSAYNETGDCTEPACLDPVYPDINPGGYQGQLQCGVYQPTNVISISYTGGEADWPASYIKRQCNEFMKLALQGVSTYLSFYEEPSLVILVTNALLL